MGSGISKSKPARPQSAAAKSLGGTLNKAGIKKVVLIRHANAKVAAREN